MHKSSMLSSVPNNEKAKGRKRFNSHVSRRDVGLWRFSKYGLEVRRKMPESPFQYRCTLCRSMVNANHFDAFLIFLIFSFKNYFLLVLKILYKLKIIMRCIRSFALVAGPWTATIAVRQQPVFVFFNIMRSYPGDCGISAISNRKGIRVRDSESLHDCYWPRSSGTDIDILSLFLAYKECIYVTNILRWRNMELSKISMSPTMSPAWICRHFNIFTTIKNVQSKARIYVCIFVYFCMVIDR